MRVGAPILEELSCTVGNLSYGRAGNGMTVYLCNAALGANARFCRGHGSNIVALAG